MAKIKVLNVIDSLYAGGAESLLKNFVIEAKKYKDFEIDVCTLYSRNVFTDELKAQGLKVYDLGLSFKYNFLRVFRLIKIIKTNDYDVVHVHLFPADVFVATASLFLRNKLKFIFSEHNVYNRRRSSKIFRLIDKFTYSRYDKVICVSEMVKDSLVKWLPEVSRKTVVIKNAVPVGELVEKNSMIYDILFVGRLEKAKGVDILFKSICLFKNDRKKELKVAIVGDGSLRDSLKSLSKDLGVEENVEFLGIRKDIKGLMQLSKIFVLPSRWEGLPMVILEAMALGMPVIATKVGGIPEVIEDGTDGILVEPENPEELAKAIEKLLGNEEFRKTISLNTYLKIKEEYSIEKYTEKLLHCYREVN